MSKNNIINAVLLSLPPKQCETIANEKQSIIIKKTKPKIKTPFKCYIYCTHDNRKNVLHLYVNSGYGRKEIGVTGNWRSGKDVVDVNPHLPAYRYNAYLAEGKVIGEFVCDNIIEYPYDYCDGVDIDDDNLLETQLEREDINIYAKGKTIYGWHISDLVIYDEPKELNEFYVEDTVSIKKCKYRFRTGQPEYVARNGGWIKGADICTKNVDTQWCENCITKSLIRSP